MIALSVVLVEMENIRDYGNMSDDEDVDDLDVSSKSCVSEKEDEKVLDAGVLVSGCVKYLYIFE